MAGPFQSSACILRANRTGPFLHSAAFINAHCQRPALRYRASILPALWPESAPHLVGPQPHPLSLGLKNYYQLTRLPRRTRRPSSTHVRSRDTTLLCTHPHPLMICLPVLFFVQELQVSTVSTNAGSGISCAITIRCFCRLFKTAALVIERLRAHPAFELIQPRVRRNSWGNGLKRPKASSLGILQSRVTTFPSQQICNYACHPA